MNLSINSYLQSLTFFVSHLNKVSILEQIYNIELTIYLTKGRGRFFFVIY